MNDRNKILQIIRHPVIKRILETRMATTSEVSRLVAMEILKEELIDPKGTDNIEKLKDYIEQRAEDIKKVQDFVNKRFTNPDDLKTAFAELQPDQFLTEEMAQPKEWYSNKKIGVKKAVQQKNYNNASFLILGELEKWQKQIIEAVKLVNQDWQKTRKTNTPNYNAFKQYLVVWLDIVATSRDILKLIEKAPEEKINECLEKLSAIIELVVENTKKDKKTFAQMSLYFIEFLQLGSFEEEDIKEAIQTLEPYKEVLAQLESEIEEFVKAYTSDPECKKQFDALKEKDKEGYIIGVFLMKYKEILEKLEKTEEKEDCITLLKQLIEMFTSKYDLDEKAFSELAVKIIDIYMAGNEPESDEEKKNILEKFNSTLKPFIEEFSEKIDNFVKMYKEDTEQCKEKVDALENDDVPKYKIAMFFINYREILEKIGTPPPDSAPPPEVIELGKDAIDKYIEAYDAFCTKFLNVKTLHAQSELFRLFYATLFGIAGINPDTIVGDQITAYTETAMPDLKVTNEGLLENEGQRQLTKDIAQNAKVVERHANAILEILDGYEKYLNIGEKDEKTGEIKYKRGTKGVEQGSRELFNKFGESDPKKLINKFVKLIVKDINGTIEVAEQLIAQADAASAETEKSEPEETGGEEAPAKRNDLLSEAPVDNSVRDLPTREKIVLVVKTGKKVCEIGARLKDMIAKEKRGGEEEPQGGQDTQGDQGGQDTQGDQGGQGEGKRDDIREDETLASDARINPDPTGPASDPGDLRKMQARQGDEINVGYRELAKEMHDLMTKIRPLFPTSQPFDTNYDFSVAKTAFKAALKGLSSHVAQVSGFEFDQVTSKEVLKSFKVKLEAFRKVIKDVFGFSEELKKAKEQASFNEEGQKSGMPHAGDGDDKDKPPGNTAELNEKLKGVIKDYENTQYILNMIMATAYDDEFVEENSKMFVPLITSQAGKITKSISDIKSSNQDTSRLLQMDYKKIERDIETASEGNFKAAYNSLEQKVISWLKRIINSKDIRPLEEDEKSNTGEKARISQTGAAMIKVMSIYFLIKRVSEKIDEGNELQEDEIKEMDELIKELLKNASLMTTIIKRYPIKEKEKDFSERAKMYYKNFHRFKIPGFIPTGIKRQEDPKGNKPESGGDEGGKRNTPPDDTETEKEQTGPSRRRRMARRRAATNESTLINKLKPLIREMLNKGK